MFTGIIEETGRIRTARNSAEGGALCVQACLVLEDTRPGDSIAVNGTCLTVTRMSDESFDVDLAPETLSRTNLGSLLEGHAVNLERSVRSDTRMGGHFVQGHVDTRGRIEAMEPDGDSLRLRIGLAPDFMRYVVPKGYIAVDGISLTVVDVFSDGFSIMLIPHTRQHVTLPDKPVGATVNVEVDILAKYAEKCRASGDFQYAEKGAPGPQPEDRLSRALDDLRQGKPVIVLDDSDRENEGDLIASATLADAALVNFMAARARGLICVSMTGADLDRLGIPRMVPGPQNGTPFESPFTVSVEAATGVTTGISAADRARTINLLGNPDSRPEDFVMPGHVFPLRAHPGGLSCRRGHTEAGVALMERAGLFPAAVICEIMNEDGSMARSPDLERFALRHDLILLDVNDIAHNQAPECVTAIEERPEIRRIDEASLPTQFGLFRVAVYKDTPGSDHLLLEYGNPSTESSPLVRIHSECLTGDALGSIRCDCGEQLQTAMERIAAEGSGALVYLRQEGRGIGLVNKIRAYAMQDKGLDTVEANVCLGFEPDPREYAAAAAILAERGISAVRLMTNNPGKVDGLECHGIRVVERIPLVIPGRPENRHYLKAKALKMSHILEESL